MTAAKIAVGAGLATTPITALLFGKVWAGALLDERRRAAAQVENSEFASRGYHTVAGQLSAERTFAMRMAGLLGGTKSPNP